MSEYPEIALIAGIIFLFGLVSRLAGRSVVTAPMVFLAAGFLAGPSGFNLVDHSIGNQVIRVLAELTLCLVLFIDASRVKMDRLAQWEGMAWRMLVVALPLTMLLGAGAALLLFPGADPWLMGLMAVILAPTDAALGQAVMANPQVPDPVKEAINVESGVNDGFALPPLFVILAILESGSQSFGTGHWFMFTAKQLILGPLAGWLVGRLGGRLVLEASHRGWMDPVFQRLSAVALAVLAFSLAESAEGNGFIAAYFAGVSLPAGKEAVLERIRSFGEAQGEELALFIFACFGLVALPPSLPLWDWRCLAYALLSLTVIRMLPVALSLTGLGLMWPTKAFLGWFGPRGVAGVLYLLVVSDELGLAELLPVVIPVVTLTITLSVFLHGVSANPLAGMYARWSAGNGRGPGRG